MTPEALPSLYMGITFRSRAEARWAIVFEHLGLRWDYEPEGFDLEAGWYLPDFYLPDMNLWFEVKPDQTDLSERPRFEELCKRTGKSGVVAYGPPATGRAHLLHFDQQLGEWAGPFAFLEDRRDESIFWLANHERGFAIGGPGKPTVHDRDPIATERLKRSFEAAQAHRFD